MRFDFVLIAFASQNHAPSANTLNSMGKAYKFAPLTRDGEIYTADFSLWNSFSESAGGNEEAKTFCPDYSTIVEAIKSAEQNNGYFLAALTQNKSFTPLGTSEVHLSLESWREIEKALPEIHFIDAGFDVVDCFSGISALANLGYIAEDIEQLERKLLQSNRFGMLSTEEEANRFVDFASSIAPEHAPFIPVKILLRMPSVRKT